MSDESGPPVRTPPALDARANSLFLDLDGTLFEIRDHPALVRPEAELSALILSTARKLDGALAILTGRPAAEAAMLLDHNVIHIAGLHGADLLESAARPHRRNDPRVRRAREDVEQRIQRHDIDVDLEDKGLGIALHYRRRPQHAELVMAIIDDAAAHHGMRALHGKMVSELTPHEASKGVALQTLAQRPPFRGRLPVAVGDDTTDEDAFRAANALGGMSILVGAPRPSSARYSLPDVAAVRAWLGAPL